ncbi:uncharacterized protein [Lepisosteus oculatus]|uniref:uncharacterized protein isoform X2 n=1 Tax=Lepisosteus oculatus TaxID=7918 RepID=UPI0035F505C4
MNSCGILVTTLLIVYSVADQEKRHRIEIRLLQKQPVPKEGNVTFHCKIPGNSSLSDNHTYKIHLLRDGDVVRSHKWNRRQSGAEFIIQRVTKANEGTYSCEISSEGFFQSSPSLSSVYLQVAGSNTWPIIVLAVAGTGLLCVFLVTFWVSRKSKTRRTPTTQTRFNCNADVYYNGKDVYYNVGPQVNVPNNQNTQSPSSPDSYAVYYILYRESLCRRTHPY